MRIVVILLLLANLALFGYTRLDAFGGSEPQRLAEQVQPEKLKLMSPQEVAALGPTKAASLADVCVEWGPLSESERARALTELAPLGVASLVSTRKIEGEGYPVTLSGFTSRASAERRAGELRTRGIADVAVIDAPGGTFAVSLGVYRTENSANGRADALAQQGIGGARVGPRRGGLTQTLLVLRDPPQPAVAKLREIAPSYVGTEIRVGGCGTS
ncbi:MAG TPA: SPOR domain-containing protein [Casimicrobiaceae bacterium]|nr:SPOR domain-containing protein [Casimicrobiaceae bacterium]